MSREPNKRGLRWPLQISQERRGGVLIVGLTGRISHRSAATLLKMLTDAVDKGVRQLVVDLGGVDYVSSPGVSAIEEVAKRLDAVRGALVLSDLAEPVRIAFSLAGASLPVEPSRESAIAYLSRPTSRFFP